jgi:preprotein translocase subunit YajC
MMDLILLQAAPGNDGFYNLIFPLAMLAVVIFIFYSQFKRNKDQRKFAESLEKGKEVVTASGILGKITKIEGEVITLEISSKTYLRVTKNAISKELTDAIFKSENSNSK